MAEGAILEPPVEEAAVEEAAAAEETAPEEVPSVMSVTTRYLIGAAEVSLPAEDGSRVLRLQSASGQAVIEANLSEELWGFIREKSTAVEVITEDDEDADRT